MSEPDLSALRPAEPLAPSAPFRLTPTALALFAGGSGDHNELHLDGEVARAAGFDSVIGQGMLTMATLARYLTSIAPQEQVRSLSVRFLEPSLLGDELICSAVVRQSESETDTLVLDLAVEAKRGALLLRGEARLSAGSLGSRR